MTVKKGYRACVREIRPTSFDRSPNQKEKKEKKEKFFSSCEKGVQVLMLKTIGSLALPYDGLVARVSPF
jgi:hypothetical protein